ncbi:MAG: AAA family ATPase [Geodermatophilaceae bacterium]|nr:AAA family ATPase [Geodermatophilaceae bacterium]
MAVSDDPAFRAFCDAGLWPGLGRTLAAALPGAGIDRPDAVTATALATLPRVTTQRAERLVSSWISAVPTYDVVTLLVAGRVEPRLAGRLTELYGDTAAPALREDPWLLLALPDVRVADADRLALAIVPGVRREDPRRGRALVSHAIARAARDGHTVLPAALVHAALVAERVPDPAVATAAAVESGAVLEYEEDDGSRLLALQRFGIAEASVAESCARLLATAEPLADRAAATSVSKGLDARQLTAVENVLEHGLCILTGGPGTGKSRTVAAVVSLVEARGRSVALAAPTGRAAKRLEELTDAPAMTVHRLLGAQGTTGDFARGEGWPLDESVIVVDEVSMLDTELAAALLEACPDGAHVLLVGDPAQLPSIGAGQVLADLLASGRIPVTELTTLYRQAEGGAIARLATAVRGGELPPVDSPDLEVVVVTATGSAQAAHRTVQLVTDSIPRALGIQAADVQVVTPVHRGPAGTTELNRALKGVLNPGQGTVSGFDPGDRVVATANHLDLEPVGFANGEVGVVTSAGEGAVTIEFASGPVKVSGKALADLRHGWAITVHRAQGSEWPGVVAVLPPEASGMLSRPLIYTALTRAQRHLSVVHAAGSVVARAVRDVGGRPRRTRLRLLLEEEIEARDGGAGNVR